MRLKMEIWKEITGYDGDYMISNFGRVKSFKRNKEIILKPRKTSKYAYVSLNGKTRYIHHLVAIEFMNHTINRDIVIDHIDNNGQNNHIDNLQIISARDNSIILVFFGFQVPHYSFLTVHTAYQRGKNAVSSPYYLLMNSV